MKRGPYKKRAFCKKGHAMTTDNTRIDRRRKDRPYRICRTCEREKRKILRASPHYRSRLLAAKRKWNNSKKGKRYFFRWRKKWRMTAIGKATEKRRAAIYRKLRVKVLRKETAKRWGDTTKGQQSTAAHNHHLPRDAPSEIVELAILISTLKKEIHNERKRTTARVIGRNL